MKLNRFKSAAVILVGILVMLLLAQASPQTELNIRVTDKTTQASPNQVKGAMRDRQHHFVVTHTERFTTSSAIYNRLQRSHAYTVRVRGWKAWALADREIIEVVIDGYDPDATKK